MLDRCRLLILVLLGVVLAACAPGRPVEPLRVEWTYWPGDWILLVAQDQGFFEKHGVRVEPHLYEIFEEAMPDLAAEKMDAGFFVVGDFVPIVKNDNLRAVFITDISSGADQVVARSEIKSLRDLKGKRIGVNLGTFGELFVYKMLERAGLRPADVTLININPENVPQAIPDQIDAGHTWEPFTSRALAQGHQVIFSSADTPGLIPDLLVMRTQVLRERPEDVRAFLRAWLEAVEFTQQYPDRAIASIAKLSGMKPEEISFEGVQLYTLEDNLAAFSQNPGSDTTSIYYTTNLYIEFLINRQSCHPSRCQSNSRSIVHFLVERTSLGSKAWSVCARWFNSL